MFLALTSKHSGDAVSDSLVRLSLKRPDMTVLDVSEVSASAAVAFQPDGCARLRLPPATEKALWARRTFVNRGLLCNESLLAGSDSIELLQTEVEHLLRQAINDAPAATARAGMYGLCGDYLPLYLQWRRVGELNLSLTTPHYTYEFCSVPPDVTGFAAPIYKSVFDLRTWKPNAAPPSFWHSFVVDRPVGQPVVSVVIGQRVLVSCAVPQATRQRIEQASVAVCKAFGTQFGEILFFHEGQQLCFAAFSHVVKQSLAAPELDQAVEALLQSHRH